MKNKPYRPRVLVVEDYPDARDMYGEYLEFSGYDTAAGLGIVSTMIDMFHDMLNGLAGEAENKFVLIDTRNTLERVASVPNGWANELHPYPTGFELLAQKFLTALQALPNAAA